MLNEAKGYIKSSICTILVQTLNQTLDEIVKRVEGGLQKLLNQEPAAAQDMGIYPGRIGTYGIKEAVNIALSEAVNSGLLLKEDLGDESRYRASEEGISLYEEGIRFMLDFPEVVGDFLNYNI